MRRIPILLFPAVLAASTLAGAGDPSDAVFAIDPAPPEARGKNHPADGKTSRYTDTAGFYTFRMPAGWDNVPIEDETPGMLFKGIQGKFPVNCVVYAKEVRRGPRTLAALQASAEAEVRAYFEPSLVADTGWKSVEKRGVLMLGEAKDGKKPVKAWTWASPAPDGKAYDTIAIVEAPAITLLTLCGSSREGKAAVETVIRHSLRLGEAALSAPAARAIAKPAAKPQSSPQFKEAMRAWQRADYEAARILLLPLAEQGDALALNNLGVMYEKGYGVAKDDAEAVKWYRKAAEQGNTKAQFSLGVMCANGRGVARDDAEASAWYLKAAQQGHAEAQYNVGLRYMNGRGVEKNPAEAAVWYRRSAEQGYAKAQVNLGLLYSKGEGVAKDDSESVKWYRLAAEQGNATAQNNLGLKLLNGRGASPDPLAATMWLSLAAEGGDKNAAARLIKLEQELGADQMAQARQRAAECKAKEFKGCQ